MGDFNDLFRTLSTLPVGIDKGGKQGIRKGSAIVMGKAKAKLGTYQPAIGPYPAWLKLKPQTVKRKNLKNGSVSRAGQKYLKAHGEWENGGNADSPLVDKGHLKQAITTDDSQLENNGVMYVGVAGGRDTGKGDMGKIASAHEFGYAPKNIPARPYLRPALHESHEEIKEAVKQALMQQLRGGF